MISGKKTKGIGKYQIEKAQKSIMAILRVISDEKPHQYSELKEKTELNSPTLTKHLKRLTEMKILRKKLTLKAENIPTQFITVQILLSHQQLPLCF